jgi:hypothetical protein
MESSVSNSQILGESTSFGVLPAPMTAFDRSTRMPAGVLISILEPERGMHWMVVTHFEFEAGRAALASFT